MQQNVHSLPGLRSSSGNTHEKNLRNLGAKAWNSVRDVAPIPVMHTHAILQDGSLGVHEYLHL